MYMVQFQVVEGCFGCEWRNEKREVHAARFVVQCFGSERRNRERNCYRVKV